MDLRFIILVFYYFHLELSQILISVRVTKPNALQEISKNNRTIDMFPI